jgi:hypothetical protein
MVSEVGLACHLTTNEVPINPWVLENVMPHMTKHDADVTGYMLPLNNIGPALLHFIEISSGRNRLDHSHTIIADSVVDIGRFCTAISTNKQGEWAHVDFPLLRFEVHNVEPWADFDAPAGAIRHNAYWDAVALQRCLSNPKLFLGQIR